MLPVGRHQAAVFVGQEPIVDQQYDAFVLRRADDAARGLQDFVHAGVTVGIVEAAASCPLKMGAQFFLPRAYLGQAGACDRHADEPFADQVHALAEHTAQHRKADQRLPVRGELFQKSGAAGVIHGAFLPQGGQFRVSCGEIFPHSLQIAVTGEERQIIPCLAMRHAGDQVAHRGDAAVPVLVPRAHMAGAP